MADHRAPGASFAIGLGGEIVCSEGFGYADVEDKARATADTAYRTASIGKLMTATAALELVEQHKLDLDVPIQTYCPRFPEKQWPVTARDLISHTSGIRHYEGPNVEAEAFNTHHYDHVSDALDLIKNDPLKQQPGTDMLYTNWGYVVEAGELKNSRWSDMSSKMAAGGWLSTAPDLFRFMNAWMAARFLSPATMKTMLEPYRLRSSTIDKFGLGWFIDDYHGMKAGLYGGGTAQVSAVVFLVPEKQLAVAGMFNLEGIPGPERVALAEAIADVLLGLTTPNPDHFAPPK